jgi:hypothetical protein
MFFRKKPVLPKPLAHWYQDIQAVEGLRELLDDPILQTAIATLQAAASPTLANSLDAAANSLRLSWLAGYNDAFRDLQRLTVLPKPYTELPESWDYIDTPNRP